MANSSQTSFGAISGSLFILVLGWRRADATTLHLGLGPTLIAYSLLIRKGTHAARIATNGYNTLYNIYGREMAYANSVSA
jgi:hypothetical protein